MSNKNDRNYVNSTAVLTSQRLNSIGATSTTQEPHRKKQAPHKYPYYYHGHLGRSHWRFCVPISPYGWYRVLVFSQYSGYTVSQVLEKLRLAVAPRKLRFYYLHVGGEQDVERDRRATFTFYVNSYELAAELQFRGHCPPVVGLRVNDRPPMIRVDEAYKWKLRTVIMSRYDERRRCLNLRRFYADDYWKQGEFCALQQFECLAAIIDIMEQELPELRRLLLDNNHLCHLGGFRGVEQRLPRLNCISLQQNELKTLRPLRVFQRLRLTELTVHRNPLPRNYERQLVLMFPQLHTLNGRSVRCGSPVVVSVSDSDDDSDVELVSITEYKPPIMPEPRVTYLAPHSLPMQLGTRKFVRRYLKAFDSVRRTDHLQRFYHENILASITLAKDNAVLGAWTAPYAAYGRQLLACRSAVLAMFAAWPTTLHLPSTMTLDLTLVQPLKLCVSITGSFEENGSSTEVRYYMRTFVLTRSMETAHFRIANELIYLARAGQRQAPALNPEQCNLMTMLSAETSLKSRWCRKFLKDTNWDYQQALLAFQTLLRRRQIHENAFESETQPEDGP
ncbi:nuclear RNA export factor 1 [Drosophila grimshawi]|uniref:GH17664 n=1 Tax=Drosophila grimshawi TaxID=7222 RepID=B4JSR1_DROGR|nr:nuclear RNA export factor 1 [Drosophila grimshawi]EDV94801.1 GH17664 [Drosophila grimshawi]